MEEIVLINGKEIVVKKLALKKYSELLGAFQELPKHYKLLEGKGTEELINQLPFLINTCYPDIVRIIKVATDMTEEEIDAMGLDNLIDLISAVAKVNNYASIYEKIKKMLPGKVIATPGTSNLGSGGQ